MTIYDSHCHVFNARILKDMIRISESKRMRGAGSVIGNWWDYLCEISSALFDSPKSHNRFILKNLKEHFPGADCYATVPLMMDVHFVFSQFLYPGQNVASGEFDSENLKDQISDLQSLSKKGNCYPFFAVDPRRRGVIDAILNGQFITRKPGGFYGIKIYPRLGYHPMSGRLPALYEYCANNNIPITTHCASTGFPTWSTEAAVFCDPEGFRPALISNPNLRINFAHFGTSSAKWGHSIIDLMHTYPNVYSDLACYTGTVELMEFKMDYWQEPIVGQRTLYGSDYDVFYFTEAGMDMDEYIQAFQKQFTVDELKNMMSVAPGRFLGI